MKIEIPEIYAGKPIEGSIEIAIAEQKRKSLEEKVQQQSAPVVQPTPTQSQIPTPQIPPITPQIPDSSINKIFKKYLSNNNIIEKDYSNINKIINKIDFSKYYN